MISGVLNLLKPPGMTSHDAVSFVRRTYGLKKVGHAGTLDPAAAGILPIALGHATRFIEYMTEEIKTYRVEITLGVSTDTGDDTGKIVSTSPFSFPPLTLLNQVLHSFEGEQHQVPPMYSAIKIGGQKLYDLARQGVVIERPPRKVQIHQIQLLAHTASTMTLDVVCSKGTYIRSLCIDIGDRLNIPAMMSFLLRTQVGNFSLEHAVSLEQIAAHPQDCLLPAERALMGLPKLILNEIETQHFIHGRPFNGDIQEEGPYAVYNLQGLLLGVGKVSVQSRQICPLKVIPGLTK